MKQFEISYMFFHPADSSKDHNGTWTTPASNETTARQAFYAEHSGSFHSIAAVKEIA